MRSKLRSTSWFVPDESSWSTVALNVARTLKSGSILALQGELGAGKTTFVQALAKALGAKRVPKSPTFSLLRTYPVKHGAIRRLLHVDAYRIEDEHDLIPLDLDAELSEPGSILAVEWPENVSAWLKKRKHMTLRITVSKQGRVAKLK
jgi:tRNA threonylcarbamoyladenosine biosynthesis protein TsaE